MWRWDSRHLPEPAVMILPPAITGITADATAMTSASKDVIQSYAEVGVVKLEVADYDYFSITVPKSDVTVGRFYPAYFTTSVVEDGALSNGCGSFTHTGATGRS